MKAFIAGVDKTLSGSQTTAWLHRKDNERSASTTRVRYCACALWFMRVRVFATNK